MQLVIFLFVLIVNISGCPDGWTHMGSSCYRTSLEKMSWYEAKEDCQAQGGYLAELTSPEEEANINEFINHNDHFWIGLTDEDTEGTFIWQESHEELVYTHWKPGQPNNLFGVEDCVFIDRHGEGWNDADCYKPSYGLCETEDKLI